MAAQIERPSPWWYRQRGTVIGTIYGAGFGLGYGLRFGGSGQAVAVDLGERLGGGAAVPAMFWLAVAAALVAWFFRAAGTSYLRRDVVFAADVQNDRLVVAGIFRYVRNPLYLGNIFLALAVGMLAPPLGYAIIVIGNIVIVIALAGEEARELAVRYGAAYAAYRRAVPAFIPRPTPANVPGSVTVEPSLRAALLGEAFCLGVAVAIVPLALFGDAGLPAFWAIWVVALVGWTFAGWRVGRRRNGDTPR
jgi:protein-S-isoprenylcysteine O-methyltransferase Ste14